MPRFDVLTLFAGYFEPLRNQGICRRAFDSGAVQLHAWNPLDHASGAHRSVDDRPYGGGPGMVMLAEPLLGALRAAQAARVATGLGAAPVLLFSPAGRPLRQADVQHLAASEGAVLVCGRYEGVDQRFIDHYVDQEISLGDFVLSGGEIPAMALIDAVARLQPGVLGDELSAQQDSFSDGLLDCPHYTRPPSFEDSEVPQVLQSGDHARIARWRRDRMIELSWRRRPELVLELERAGRLDRQDLRMLATLRARDAQPPEEPAGTP
ncbi:tRNA (guanosine(37)-N1)-methyltransferase TrmD [Thiomonas sp.]|uniref:tRNA (guanosine(37)-N1)-methyltransferase TrmD n=1 Tax=Thiomonas sp. TaxID=2047785 RepID=UPI002632EDFC|nr:tRNA (guanosine(37)-N1)-methyltransferase TrmD [Thiomonas sp.]